jgi:hypothetical protein
MYSWPWGSSMMDSLLALPKRYLLTVLQDYCQLW